MRIPVAVTGSRDPRQVQRFSSAATIILLFIASLVLSRFLLTRLGPSMFLYALIGLLVGGVYALFSFKNLTTPFLVLILSIGGFRYIWSIQAPLLPDLYLDRMMLIWLALVMMVKYVAEGRTLKGPWLLDLLILGHAAYLLIRVYMDGMRNIHPWTMSIMVPYSVYFLSKNIVTTKQQVRTLLLALVILSVYYHITSIAEKFHINALLWPRYMAEQHKEFIGRSNGPFRNAGIFGFTMGMLLPLNLYFVHTSRRTWAKVFFLLNLALGFAALYFTYTRGAWVASAACLGTVVLLNRRHYLRILLPLAILAPLFATFFLGMGQDKFMKERVENEDTIGARVGTMITAFRVWRDHPFLGCGTYRYVEVRADYLAPVEVPGLDTIRINQFRGAGAHDMYLGPLAEDGLVGAAFQYTIYFLIFRVLWSKYKGMRRGDYFGIYFLPFCAGIIVLYLVGGLAQTFRHVTMMGSMFYMVVGIMNGYRHDLDDESAADGRRLEGGME